MDVSMGSTTRGAAEGSPANGFGRGSFTLPSACLITLHASALPDPTRAHNVSAGFEVSLETTSPRLSRVSRVPFLTLPAR